MADERNDDTELIRRSIDVGIDGDEVWELLVDDDERSAWFGGPTQLEPHPGGDGTFTDPDGTRRRATVEVAEPGRHLRWTWWPEDGTPGDASRVDVTLVPIPGGTRVTVVERPLVPTARMAAAPGPAGVALVGLELAALLRAMAPAIVA